MRQERLTGNVGHVAVVRCECLGEYRKKDLEKIVGIQRRAIKLISQLRDLSYQNRLIEFNLTILEIRRVVMWGYWEYHSEGG